MSAELDLLLLGAALALALLAAVLVAVAIVLRKRGKSAGGVQGDAQAPAPRPKAKKGEVRRRKEHRPPFTGQRLKIYIPGRRPKGAAPAIGAGAPSGPADSASDGVPSAAGESQALALTPPLAASSTAGSSSAPDAARAQGPAPSPSAAPSRCSKCGQSAEEGRSLCSLCAAEEKVSATAELITSIRLKGIETLDAERPLYQARSALAIRALEDVHQLCERAEERARELEMEHKEAQELLTRCKRELSAAMEEGKGTELAQKRLEGALKLFQEGRYLEAMEEAATVPSLIPPSSPSLRIEGTLRPKPLPKTAPITPLCPTCGEEVPQDAHRCSLCGSSVGEKSDGKHQPPPELCPGCGKRMEPYWRLCPYCDAEIPGQRAIPPPRPRVIREEKREAAAIPPVEREKALLAEIEKIEGLLKEVEKRGGDARKGRSLLELAASFAQSRNYDKGERYVRKARHVAETLLGD